MIELTLALGAALLALILRLGKMAEDLSATKRKHQLSTVQAEFWQRMYISSVNTKVAKAPVAPKPVVRATVPAHYVPSADPLTKG